MLNAYLASNDMSYPHVMIINYGGKVICWEVVRLDQYGVSGS